MPKMLDDLIQFSYDERKDACVVYAVCVYFRSTEEANLFGSDRLVVTDRMREHALLFTRSSDARFIYSTNQFHVMNNALDEYGAIDCKNQCILVTELVFKKELLEELSNCISNYDMYGSALSFTPNQKFYTTSWLYALKELPKVSIINITEDNRVVNYHMLDEKGKDLLATTTIKNRRKVQNEQNS